MPPPAAAALPRRLPPPGAPAAAWWAAGRSSCAAGPAGQGLPSSAPPEAPWAELQQEGSSGEGAVQLGSWEQKHFFFRGGAVGSRGVPATLPAVHSGPRGRRGACTLFFCLLAFTARAFGRTQKGKQAPASLSGSTQRKSFRKKGPPDLLPGWGWPPP